MLKGTLFTFTIVMVTFSFYLQPSKEISGLFLITNFLIILLCTLALVQYANEYYSLRKVVLTFNLFFFGLIPFVDHATGVTYWGGSALSVKSMIEANLLILISLIAYLGSYSLFRQIYVDGDSIIESDATRWRLIHRAGNNGLTVVVFLSLSASAINLWYNNFDIVGVFFRGGGDGGRVSLSGPFWLIFTYFIKIFPAAAFLFLSMCHKNSSNWYSKFCVVLSFILLIVFLSPTSSARFLIAAIYISVLVSQTKLLNGSYRLPVAIFLGLFVVFPVLDIFRRVDSSISDFSYNLNFLAQGHFDAYQNLVRIVDAGVVTMGRQLIGALLFFIPRSAWPSKPIGSGSYMADITQLDWANISFPFVAEGYINFSIYGVATFSIFLGIITSFADKRFWLLTSKGYTHSYFPAYYLSLGMLFFVLRGDLMSSYAYTVGVLSASFVVLRLVTWTGHAKKNLRYRI